MDTLRLASVFLIISITFASVIVGTISYYNSKIAYLNGQIVNKNNELSNQNSEIANLTSQNSNLRSQVAGLTTANLTASLSGDEEPSNLTGGQAYLIIHGSVSNVGTRTAYNAGLHIVAYNAQVVLEINATVALAWGEEFTNPYGNWQSAYNPIGNSYSLTSLEGGQTTQINLSIFHSDTVTNWTITPVWTNSS